MVEVIWTKKSYGQFERAIKYIYREQGFYYADIVRNKILETTRHLENNPNLGRCASCLKVVDEELRLQNRQNFFSLLPTYNFFLCPACNKLFCR